MYFVLIISDYQLKSYQNQRFSPSWSC